MKENEKLPDEYGFIRYEDVDEIDASQIKPCKDVSFYTDKGDKNLIISGYLPITKSITVWGYKSADVSSLRIPNGTTVLFVHVRKIIGINEFAKNNLPFKYDFCESNISCLTEEFWSALSKDVRMVIDHCRGLKSIKGLAGIHTLNFFSSYIKDEDATNLSKCQYAYYRCKDMGYKESESM